MGEQAVRAAGMASACVGLGVMGPQGWLLVQVSGEQGGPGEVLFP